MKKNEEIEKEIDKEEKKIKAARDYEEKLKRRKQALSDDQIKKYNSLKQVCFSRRNDVKAFSKLKLQHPGSSDNHLNQINRILDSGINNSKKLSELALKYKELYEEEIINIKANIDSKLYFSIRKLEVKINRLLDEVIVGNKDVDISNLIDILGIKNWVEEGVGMLDKKKNTQPCPFCQKETIDQSLIQKFETYFDEAYKRKIQKIQQLQSQYKNLTKDLLINIQSIKNEYDKKSTTSSLFVKLKDFISQNYSTIEEKLKFSNEKKLLPSIKNYKSKFSQLIKDIKLNNIGFENLDRNRKEFENDVWAYLSLESKEDINSFAERVEKYNRISSLIENLTLKTIKTISVSHDLINELKEKTISTKIAIDNINGILKNSGFDGFEIAEKPEKVNNISQYYLKRGSIKNENIFKTLSEGEKNFIAFLYFYQLCLGTDDLEESNLKKIVVIDDPVSSLDSQVLFILSNLIHQIIEKKGKGEGLASDFKKTSVLQVFILTHNIYFYKEIALKHRPICTNKSHYQIKKIGKTSIEEIKEKDLILDDYSLLWYSLKELKNKLERNEHDFNILIANNMRRILESYVNFNGIGKDVWHSLEEIDKDSPEYILSCAFLSSIHDESHKISPLDDFYYQRIVNNEPQKLFEVFETIFKKIGRDHYDLMMSKA